ncbi:heart and neural crest derivatives expressed [Echinococcus multilocularis]|uniref:Heart and neural crest derivatives expressed n=1 Tax=Echinococcus multilocularis TaxID=6211 RepID=A0A068YAG4_ECHMU|nr:heart and neural crest derivatives expressed [Echinococcus multilocularis]
MEFGTQQLALWHKRRKQQEKKSLRCDEKLCSSGKRVRASIFNPAVNLLEIKSSNIKEDKWNSSTDVQSEDDEYERKRRATQREQDRRRTEALNRAFAQLRASLPHVPQDTKLTKLRTLRIAIAYIRQLQAVTQLQSQDNHSSSPPSFPPPPLPPWAP